MTNKKQPTKHSNIFSYTTKKGIKKYRVIISVNGVPIDKSGFSTINEAKSFLLNINQVVNQKIKKNEQHLKDITFEAYYEIYVQKMMDLSKWTYSTYREKENKFKLINNFFTGKMLSEITKQDCQNFIDKLFTDNYRKSTLIYIKACVVALLNEAIKDELIETNKMKLVSIPNIKIKPIDKNLSSAEYHKAKEYASKYFNIQLRTLFHLCSLGLRKGEALAISENKLTFNDDGTVKILVNDTTTIYSPSGTGNTKTKQDRFIFGNNVLSKLLRECITDTKQIYLHAKKSYNKNTPIIATSKATTYKTVTINYHFKIMSNKLNICITPHKLRHYFATQGQLTGLNPRLIADFLGHKNISMTNHYSHQTEEGTRLVLDKIQNLL